MLFAKKILKLLYYNYITEIIFQKKQKEDIEKIKKKEIKLN